VSKDLRHADEYLSGRPACWFLVWAVERGEQLVAGREYQFEHSFDMIGGHGHP
jgi:hypothetical protein